MEAPGHVPRVPCSPKSGTAYANVRSWTDHIFYSCRTGGTIMIQLICFPEGNHPVTSVIIALLIVLIASSSSKIFPTVRCYSCLC